MATIGGYELVGRVWVNGTGALWKGRDPRLDRLVALKQVGAHAWFAAERLHHEAAVLGTLTHPNIVAVHALLEHGGELWLVEEWVEGAPLTALLARERLTGPQAVGVMAGALTGLAEVHRRGLVHGDISPANIIVDTTGTSKLVDFGLAAPSGIRGVGGTPGYVSPEAVRGQTVTPRSDVYGSGAVLGTLLLGGPLFTGPTAEAVIDRQLTGPGPDLGGIPAATRRVLERSIQLVPEQRHAEAGQLLDDLQRAAAADLGDNWGRDASVAALVAAAGTFSGWLLTHTPSGAVTGHGGGPGAGRETAARPAPHRPSAPQPAEHPGPSSPASGDASAPARAARGMLRRRPVLAAGVTAGVAAAIVGGLLIASSSSSAPNSYATPQDTVRAYYSNAMAGRWSMACTHVEPSALPLCTSATSGLPPSTGSVKVSVATTVGSRSLVGVTGHLCDPSQGCATNSDARAGIPAGRGGFNAAYDRAVASSTTGSLAISPLPCLRVDGKWYVTLG